jgi:carbon storage regulator
MGLVLSRKLFERIYIGPDICVTVVDIDRGKIRLMIEAPRTTPIYRAEILPPGHPAAFRETGGQDELAPSLAPADVETVADAGNVGNTHELSEAFDLADVMDRR